MTLYGVYGWLKIIKSGIDVSNDGARRSKIKAVEMAMEVIKEKIEKDGYQIIDKAIVNLYLDNDDKDIGIESNISKNDLIVLLRETLRRLEKGKVSE